MTKEQNKGLALRKKILQWCPESLLDEYEDAIRESEAESLREREPATEAVLEGHGEPCYYCGEPCNSLAGDPSRWPLGFPHRNEPGKLKWQHAGCVTDRLLENNVGLTTVLTGSSEAALKGKGASQGGVGLSVHEADIIAAAVQLAPLLEEGWDEYDTPEDQSEGARACDALVKAVNAMLTDEQKAKP